MFWMCLMMLLNIFESLTHLLRPPGSIQHPALLLDRVLFLNPKGGLTRQLLGSPDPKPLKGFQMEAMISCQACTKIGSAGGVGCHHGLEEGLLISTSESSGSCICIPDPATPHRFLL